MFNFDVIFEKAVYLRRRYFIFYIKIRTYLTEPISDLKIVTYLTIEISNQKIEKYEMCDKTRKKESMYIPTYSKIGSLLG